MRKIRDFILLAVVFLIAAIGLFFLSVMFCLILFAEHKPIAFPMVIVGLAMFVYVFVRAVRLIPSFKKISSFQPRHLLLAVAWGFLFGFPVALFFVGNVIIVAAPK